MAPNNHTDHDSAARTKQGTSAMPSRKTFQILPTHGYTPQLVLAEIKRSSKYYGQTEPNVLFPVYVDSQRGDYCIQGGPGGQYRRADVNLYVLDGKTPVRL